MVGQFVLFCFYADQLKTAMVSKQSELTVDNREFKKLRPLLQRKRHFKVELWVRLTFLRFIPSWSLCNKQAREVHVRLLGMSGFQAKVKIYCCGIALSSKPQLFHVRRR